MNIEYIMVFFVAPILTTVLAATLLSRHRIARKKQVSYETMIASACIVGLLWLVCVTEGRCFRLGFWSPEYGPKHKLGPEWPFSLLKNLGFVAAISALSALGVVAYFQKRGKRNEIQAAKSPSLSKNLFSLF